MQFCPNGAQRPYRSSTPEQLALRNDRQFLFLRRSQLESEHYPRSLVMENIARQRQELLNDSLAGGMMGGYIEPGFPFYFINRQMLAYLGYESEAEFISDIGGMISNCMAPEDTAGAT